MDGIIYFVIRFIICQCFEELNVGKLYGLESLNLFNIQEYVCLLEGMYNRVYYSIIYNLVGMLSIGAW